MENLSLDSTVIKAHPHSAGAIAKTINLLPQVVGGKSTKIHAVVDGLGNPVYFQLTGGISMMQWLLRRAVTS